MAPARVECNFCNEVRRDVLGTGLAALGQTGHAAKNPASKAGATARQGQKPAQTVAPPVSKEDLEQVKQTIADERREEQQRFDTLQQQNQQLEQQLKSTQDKLNDAPRASAPESRYK